MCVCPALKVAASSDVLEIAAWTNMLRELQKINQRSSSLPGALCHVYCRKSATGQGVMGGMGIEALQRTI